MNTTERVIVEQFPFWHDAPSPPAVTAADTHHVIVGCGTSFHLAQSIAASFNLQGLRAKAVPGGEWSRRWHAYHQFDKKTHVIALSRSGESTETIQALQASREAGFSTTAVTCEQGSGVTRAAEATIYARTHPDEGIVMTASASVMLLVGLRLAGITVEAADIEAAEALLEAAEAQFTHVLAGRSHFVYLGGGPLCGIASEGSIKVQEMSLSYAQSYPCMEYRHGPISLVDERTFVVLFYSEATRDEEARVAQEITDKGGRVLGIGGPGDISLCVAGNPMARSLIVLPVLQILGERVAGLRGLDTSAPRHLNKVVVLK